MSSASGSGNNNSGSGGTKKTNVVPSSVKAGSKRKQTDSDDDADNDDDHENQDMKQRPSKTKSKGSKKSADKDNDDETTKSEKRVKQSQQSQAPKKSKTKPKNDDDDDDNKSEQDDDSDGDTKDSNHKKKKKKDAEEVFDRSLYANMDAKLLEAKEQAFNRRRDFAKTVLVEKIDLNKFNESNNVKDAVEVRDWNLSKLTLQPPSKEEWGKTNMIFLNHVYDRQAFALLVTGTLDKTPGPTRDGSVALYFEIEDKATQNKFFQADQVIRHQIEQWMLGSKLSEFKKFTENREKEMKDGGKPSGEFEYRPIIQLQQPRDKEERKIPKYKWKPEWERCGPPVVKVGVKYKKIRDKNNQVSTISDVNGNQIKALDLKGGNKLTAVAELLYAYIQRKKNEKTGEWEISYGMSLKLDSAQQITTTEKSGSFRPQFRKVSMFSSTAASASSGSSSTTTTPGTYTGTPAFVQASAASGDAIMSKPEKKEDPTIAAVAKASEDDKAKKLAEKQKQMSDAAIRTLEAIKGPAASGAASGATAVAGSVVAVKS